MSFDGIFLNRTVSILKDKIIGCRINKIYQVSATDFIFNLFSKSIKTNLVISVNNNGSYLSLNDNPSKDKQEKNHFTNSLFYHLVNGNILDIEQINNDRIVRIIVNKSDELGIVKTSHLYIELTGKATNIILTKDNDVIIDCLHKLGVSSNRTIAAGGKYKPPFFINNEQTDIFNAEYDSSIPLKDQFVGFSLNLLKEFEERLKNQSFESIVDELRNSNKIYLYEKDYHLIELKHLNSSFEVLDIFEGLNKYYSKKVFVTVSDEHKDLIKAVNKEIRHYSSKIIKLTEELKNAENSGTFLQYGDDIFAYGQDLDTKLKTITINNGFEEYKIDLDEKISVKDNALKFYKKYKKLKNSTEIIQEQINIAKDNLDYFNNILIQINNCSNEELLDIKTELINQKVIKGKVLPNYKSKQKKINIQQYEIDGVKVSVGKNNLQNEYLTFKQARYDEYFFHVKDYSGSHVIVHSNKLNEKLIRFAANLAALYSQAKDSTSVPVDYTMVKNVKKIPNGKPGKVILKDYKTIYIDPEK